MYVKNCRGQLAPKHLFKSLNAVRPPRRPSAAHVQVQSLVFATDRLSLSLYRSL